MQYFPFPDVLADTLYTCLVVQPIGALLVLFAHRRMLRVLPDCNLSSMAIPWFLLIGFCCYQDGLLSRHHANQIIIAEILETAGFFVGFLGALVGTVGALGEREDYMFWVVLLLYLLETVLCYFLFRRLLPSPHDSGHDVQETDNSVEIV